MRSLPAGRPRSQTVSAMPYPTAMAEQMSANSTAWSLKKLPTITPTPSQSWRQSAWRDASFYHKVPDEASVARGFGKGELEVRRDLAKVADHVLRDRALENGQQRAEGVDRQLR